MPYRKGFNVEPGERSALIMSTWPKRLASLISTEPRYARTAMVSSSTTRIAAEVCSGSRARQPSNRSSRRRCRVASTVVRISGGLSGRFRRRASKGARLGSRRGASSSGSSRASSTADCGHTWNSARRRKTLSRASWARCGCRSGRRRLGACGSTASKAASAWVNCAGDLPRYAQLAAATPCNVPPNGARFR